MLYMFMVFLLLDLGRLVRLVPRDWLYSNWITLGTLTALLVVIFVYGNLHYHHKYRQELTLTTDKPLQKELKLVMLSDMHIGYHNRRADLARWVDMLNEEHADMILENLEKQRFFAFGCLCSLSTVILAWKGLRPSTCQRLMLRNAAWQ